MSEAWTVVSKEQLYVQGFLYNGYDAHGATPHLRTDCIHLTGFTDVMLSVGNVGPSALAMMRGRPFLTWGGDHYNAQSFTSVIPSFLAANEQSKVLAFRNRGNHEQFKQSWSTFAEQYRGRFYIVEVDVQAEAACHDVLQEASALGGAAQYFLLGRLAVRMCGTLRVVALGGGGIVGHEMRCGVHGELARWTVFALSRGRQEQNNTLMDEAAQNANVELVLNVDPNEAQAFARGRPAAPHPPPSWSQVAAPAVTARGQPPPPVPAEFIGHGAAAVYQPPPQPAPPPMPAVPQPVPQPAPQPAQAQQSQSQVLPLNGSGLDDVQSIGYMPLINFITGFQPTKTCEEYMRQDVCSVPAMAPVARFIEDIVTQCKLCSQQSMANGIDRRFPGLNHDMVFAAIVFTFELQVANLQARDENEFYRQYNNTMRQRNVMTMRALAGYSHFLCRAVSLMPAHEGVLWRGIRGDDAVRLAIDRYGDGMEINWSAWSSASVSRDVSKDSFATHHGAARGLLMRIETRRSARDISQLSIMPREQERVVFPNTKFVVLRPYHIAEDGIGEIHLKEMSNSTFVF